MNARFWARISSITKTKDGDEKIKVEGDQRYWSLIGWQNALIGWQGTKEQRRELEQKQEEDKRKAQLLPYQSALNLLVTDPALKGRLEPGQELYVTISTEKPEWIDSPT